MTSVPQVPIKGSLLRGVFLEEARRESYLQAHYLLSQLGDPGPGCVSVKDRPPVYAFGAKSPVKKGKMAILSADLAAKGCTDPWCPAKGCGANGVSCESASVRGLDCTGFVSAAFAAAGLKFSTDPSVQYGSPFFGDTDLLHRLRNFESSCLAEVRTTAEVPLRPGDLINLGSRNGHVVMVESVGADPLGIARSKGDCSKITVKDFDFVFAQSGVPWGVSRVDIQAYRKRVAPVWLSELVTYARNNCEARTARKLAAPSAAKEKQQEASKRVFSVLRHLGSSKSACLAAPLPVEGEECVRTCAP